MSVTLAELTSTTARQPRILTYASEIHALVRAARQAGKSIGLVPTMGAIHAGHLSLVEASVRDCDLTVATIFVNPTQFGQGEDLSHYPRSEAMDVKRLSEWNVDVVFIPQKGEMYPPGFSTYVKPPEVAAPLEGRCRPGHFQGVTTIVLKLFQLIPADIAYFGQKDYQQSLVIRHMVQDLNIPTRVFVCPTVRDASGIALSSRNDYLTDDEQQQAKALSQSLRVAAELVQQGQRDAAAIAARMRQVFADAGVVHVDYISLADPESLGEVQHITQPTMALVAARIGNTRLIDNELLTP